MAPPAGGPAERADGAVAGWVPGRGGGGDQVRFRGQLHLSRHGNGEDGDVQRGRDEEVCDGRWRRLQPDRHPHWG